MHLDLELDVGFLARPECGRGLDERLQIGLNVADSLVRWPDLTCVRGSMSARWLRRNHGKELFTVNPDHPPVRLLLRVICIKAPQRRPERGILRSKSVAEVERLAIRACRGDEGALRMLASISSIRIST